MLPERRSEELLDSNETGRSVVRLGADEAVPSPRSARPELIGRSYMRIFQHDSMTYALTMPGTLSRSADGQSGFEIGPTLFNPNMRHAAVLKHDGTLWVFWTRSATHQNAFCSAASRSTATGMVGVTSHRSRSCGQNIHGGATARICPLSAARLWRREPTP